MACIHIAGFLHESNSFSAVATDLAAFEHCAYTAGLKRGSGVFDLRVSPLAIGGFIQRAEALGHDLHPLLYAFAEPSGPVTRDAFELVLDELVARIAAGPPPDAVFLDLHGAMVVEHHDDGEAEILRRIRQAVGNIPIVTALDLHGNIGASTLKDADLAAAYLTYPHIDMAERGGKLAVLLDHMLATGTRPAMAYQQLPFLIPDQCQSTDLEPARSLYAMARDMEEQSGIWSVSLMCGFYQADVEFAGPSIFVFADTQAAADSALAGLAGAVMDAEGSFRGELLAVQAAADLASRWSGSTPLILADIQDNPGGGAASDNVELLEALLGSGVRNAAVGMICDPAAARQAHASGIGSTINLSLGGKGTPTQRPLVADFEVTALREGTVALTGPFSGLDIDLGLSAAVRIGGIDVIICSKPTQCLDRAYFRVHEIMPEERHVLVLKSAAHYRGDFAAIAGQIADVATDSACVADATRLPYTRLRTTVRLSGHGRTLADIQRSE